VNNGVYRAGFATAQEKYDQAVTALFKCNLRRLTDYPRLWRYARRIHARPGVARTVDLDESKAHYYRSMPEINPSGVVPKGPLLDFSS
jgi:glutathionyl-hydroquinone reductase